MPGLEELRCYVWGVWLLVSGKRDGFLWLDMTDRGFRRSWWAIVFCLPPMALDFIASRAYYLAGMPENTHVGRLFWSGMFLLELVSWTAPYILLYIAMTASGLQAAFRPAVTVVNWLAVPIQWLLMATSIVTIAAPANADLQSSVALVLYLIAAGAHFMALWQVLDRAYLPAFAFLVALGAGSLLAQFYVLGALGLSFG